jgi:hypothetical protein
VHELKGRLEVGGVPICSLDCMVSEEMRHRKKENARDFVLVGFHIQFISCFEQVLRNRFLVDCRKVSKCA